MLRSRRYADKVAVDPEFAQAGGDLAGELIGNLQTRPIPGTNFYEVHLEGTDPDRTARMLNKLLAVFQEQAKDDSKDMIERSKIYAQNSLKALDGELAGLDKRIENLLKDSPYFAPGGKSLIQDAYVSLQAAIQQKRAKFDDLNHQAKVAQLYPSARSLR